MSTNETQPTPAMSSRTDDMITLGLSLILAISLGINLYFIVNALWRWRQERAAAVIRSMEEQKY